MLIVEISTEIEARKMAIQLSEVICKTAPIIIIPEIALVIAIRGVCKAWLTFQIT